MHVAKLHPHSFTVAPYGVREGGRKIGSRKEVVTPVPSEM